VSPLDTAPGHIRFNVTMSWRVRDGPGAKRQHWREIDSVME